MATFDKGHGMISGRQEMLALMRFWGALLGAAPPSPADGEEVVELATGQQGFCTVEEKHKFC